MWVKLLEKIKEHQSDIVLSAVIILITVISFQSGKILVLKNRGGAGIEIKEASIEEIFGETRLSQKEDSTKDADVKNQFNIGVGKFSVVASKNSNKYHYSWCPGAGKISDKNKITFPTEAAALATGYMLASNCKK